MKTDDIPHLSKGTYILILRLDQTRTLQVGRLGAFSFQAGFYAYVGSAMGSGGLGARLSHHLKISERPHWHIDYLRRGGAEIAQIWCLEAPARLEHEWAKALEHLSGTSQPVARFGASDCTCASHLFFYPHLPSFSEFQNQTARHLTGGGSVSLIEISR